MNIFFVAAMVCVMTGLVIKYYRKRTSRITYILAMSAIPFLIVSFVIELYPVSNYWTSPYFSQEAFRKISPGMTAEEVHDLIGQPLERWYSEISAPKTSSKSDREWWVYSKAQRPHKPYKRFVVVFDKEDQIVVETTDYELRP